MNFVSLPRRDVALWAVALATICAPATRSSACLGAQGITTATIGGTVRLADGAAADDAHVRVINLATGYSVEVQVRRGRFLVPGLEVGGPYVVGVRRIGAVPHERGGVTLTLGQQLELDFVLGAGTTLLDTVRVTTTADPAIAQSGAGTGATISDSLLRRMPALNRDVLDFARLVPQAGTRFGALSGGGVGFRFNSYLIDGASERLLGGNGALAGTAGGKVISIDAVKEYQVLLAPFDVRYGDFAGALVNAVTKSGTNDLHGTAFLYSRNEQLARNAPFLREAPYDRTQLGFSVGGPIVRDRAHFFVASEIQRMRQPATGPYIGQAASSPSPVPVTEGDVARFADILGGYGLEPGTGGLVTRANPNVNVFARVDISLPAWRSRAIARHNRAATEQTFFARSRTTGQFPLSSNAWDNRQTRSSTTAQLFTQLPRGALNEALIGYTYSTNGASRFLHSPLIQATVPGGQLVGGPAEMGHAYGLRMMTVEIADHVVMRPGERHTISAGTRSELFSIHYIATRGQFGRWTFTGLDALERGEASSFRVERDFGSATKPLRGAHTSAYIGDVWQATDRLSLTGGLRADLLTFSTRPSYNPAVDTIFGRRTSDFPTSRLHWSPRGAFAWDLDPDRGERLRGGAGVFVGRPPLGWLSANLRFDGMGTRTLTCAGAGVVPAFTPDPRNLPASCADGRGVGDGPVNLVDPGLRMAEMFRASLAYDRVVAWDVNASIEALYTRTLSDFVFQNANLAGPQGTDRHGRVLYGTIDPSGRARPAFVAARYPEVIDLRNHDKGYSVALTARLEKQFSEGIEASVAYTRSRVRDVQSITAGSAAATFPLWAGSRAVSGHHENLTATVSSYEIPHRIVLAGTWTAPWKRWATNASLYYIGESGIPFTYTDSTAGGLGDLNADSTNANDPIYVPRNTADTSEIMFAGTPDEVLRQQAAMESAISGSACLRRQRGRILARNSCIAPWVHSSGLAVRQALPALRGHQVSLELEIFNVLNLIHRNWGLNRVPNTIPVRQVGQTAGPATSSQPVFRFVDGWRAYSTDNAESAYQLQLALRYRF